jgi:hypothetical protein
LKYWTAVVAKLVQQSSNYPEFKGLTPGAAGSRRKLWKEKSLWDIGYKLVE